MDFVPTRQLPTSDYLRLKAATRDLVALAGGPRRAEGLTRGTASRFSEYGAPHCERFYCVDQVADLEAEAGEPVVTRALAALMGCEVVPRQKLKAEPVADALAQMIAETSRVAAQMVKAMADKRLSQRECDGLKRDIDAAIAGLHELRCSLEGVEVSRP